MKRKERKGKEEKRREGKRKGREGKGRGREGEGKERIPSVWGFLKEKKRTKSESQRERKKTSVTAGRN